MYTKQWIDESDLKAVTDALKQPMITRGENVLKFEETVAGYYDAKFAIAFSSGTSALAAAYAAAEVGPYDRIVTSPNTYIGAVTGALQRGAKLHFVDIEPTTGHMQISEKIEPTSRGRLIYLPMHYAGAPMDMAKLGRTILDPNAVVIEDAAHAFGSKSLGKDSDMMMFSFHPAKTITTGEGGMILTNSEKYAKALRAFRNNGEGEMLSGNHHLTEMQAALGLSQFKRLDQILEKRRKLVNIYREEGVTLLDDHPDSANHLAVALVEKRDAVREKLSSMGFGTQVHYLPLYRHPLVDGGPLPEMERFYERALSLPLYYGLEEGKVREVAQVLRKP